MLTVYCCDCSCHSPPKTTKCMATTEYYRIFPLRRRCCSTLRQSSHSHTLYIWTIFTYLFAVAVVVALIVSVACLFCFRSVHNAVFPFCPALLTPPVWLASCLTALLGCLACSLTSCLMAGLAGALAASGTGIESFLLLVMTSSSIILRLVPIESTYIHTHTRSFPPLLPFCWRFFLLTRLRRFAKRPFNYYALSLTTRWHTHTPLTLLTLYSPSVRLLVFGESRLRCLHTHTHPWEFFMAA